MAAEEVADRQHPAQRIEGDTQGRLARGASVARIHQLLDTARQRVLGEQRVADHLLQFLDLHLQVVGGAAAGARDPIVGLAGQAGRPQSALGIVVGQGLHVIAMGGQFGLGPAFEIVGHHDAGRVDHAAEAIPAAAREHLAKGEIRGNARQIARQGGRPLGNRNLHASFAERFAQLAQHRVIAGVRHDLVPSEE